MKQQNPWVKYLPILIGLGIVALAIFGVVYVTSQPEVLLAKAQQATARATLFTSQQVYHQQLPEILKNQALLIGGSALAVGLAAFGIAMAISLVIGNIDRAISHGLEFERNINGQKTVLKLYHSNPVHNTRQLGVGGGNQPRVRVEDPRQGQLEGNTRKPLAEGRKLSPDERTAPGRGKPQAQQPLPGMQPELAGAGRPRVNHDDPLSRIDEPVF